MMFLETGFSSHNHPTLVHQFEATPIPAPINHALIRSPDGAEDKTSWSSAIVLFLLSVHRLIKDYGDDDWIFLRAEVASRLMWRSTSCAAWVSAGMAA